jgi:hypothetical protein
MKFRRSVEIEAHQWLKNGDHPKDGDPATEGEVVRRYRNHGMDGDAICTCGHKFSDHGWIDQDNEGHCVCPGDWIVNNGDYRYCVWDDADLRANWEEVPE